MTMFARRATLEDLTVRPHLIERIVLDGRILADRIRRGGWDETFTCPDGLMVNDACANLLSPFPGRALGLVESYLGGYHTCRERLARMVEGSIPSAETERLMRVYEVKPPFPGRTGPRCDTESGSNRPCS